MAAEEKKELDPFMEAVINLNLWCDNKSSPVDENVVKWLEILGQQFYAQNNILTKRGVCNQILNRPVGTFQHSMDCFVTACRNISVLFEALKILIVQFSKMADIHFRLAGKYNGLLKRFIILN